MCVHMRAYVCLRACNERRLTTGFSTLPTMQGSYLGEADMWLTAKVNTFVKPISTGKTSERQGGVHMGFSQHADTILN